MAVVIKKEGLLAFMGHNHLIYASDYSATPSFSPSKLEPFSISFQHEDLVNDDYWVSQNYFPKLRKLGILREKFSELKDEDIATVKGHMLGEEQLGKEGVIEATLTNLAPLAEGLYQYEGDLSLTVKGITRTTAVSVELTPDDGILEGELHGAFRFRDFGIEPFSALGGQLRNQDRFYVYAHLEFVAVAE